MRQDDPRRESRKLKPGVVHPRVNAVEARGVMPPALPGKQTGRNLRNLEWTVATENADRPQEDLRPRPRARTGSEIEIAREEVIARQHGAPLLF